MVLLLHHSRGLGAVKALTVSLALLGVKDVQDLLAVPLQASNSSPVYVLQLCVCMQNTTLAIDFQSLHFGRVRNPLLFSQTWFVSGFWLVWPSFGSDLSSPFSECLQD